MRSIVPRPFPLVLVLLVVIGAITVIETRSSAPGTADTPAPAGFINTDGVSISEVRGEKVVLVDFWTYSCYNCQNTQPYLNAWHEGYADDGLFITGIHTPEFGFEKERATDDEAVLENGFLNVGWLKGDQTYALPKNFDPEEQGAVPVWCSLPRRRYARYCQL